jgi:hypothetical protein
MNKDHLTYFVLIALPLVVGANVSVKSEKYKVQSENRQPINLPHRDRKLKGVKVTKKVPGLPDVNWFSKHIEPIDKLYNHIPHYNA